MYETLIRLEDNWDIDLLKKASELTFTSYNEGIITYDDKDYIEVSWLFGYINELVDLAERLNKEIEEKDKDLHRLTRGEDEYYDD